MESYASFVSTLGSTLTRFVVTQRARGRPNWGGAGSGTVLLLWEHAYGSLSLGSCLKNWCGTNSSHLCTAGKNFMAFSASVGLRINQISKSLDSDSYRGEYELAGLPYRSARAFRLGGGDQPAPNRSRPHYCRSTTDAHAGGKGEKVQWSQSESALDC